MKRSLVAIMLVVAGCGSGPGPVGGSADAGAAATVSQACADGMSGFTDALLELDSRLNVGMNFQAYSEHVADARVAYDKIKISALDADCLKYVAAPAEEAYNQYVEAYTTWNECISKSGCTNDSIKSKLQDRWSVATTTLKAIKSHLP